MRSLIRNESLVAVVEWAETAHDELHLVIRGDRIILVMVRWQRITRVTLEQNSHFQASTLRFFVLNCDQLIQEFSQDATDTPHVDRLPVVLVEDADLRSSVPARLDVCRKLTVLPLFFLMVLQLQICDHCYLAIYLRLRRFQKISLNILILILFCSKRLDRRISAFEQVLFLVRPWFYFILILKAHFDRTRRTKITQLDLASVINQYVRRFDVTMHNISSMEEAHRTQQVVHDDFDVIFGQGFDSFDEHTPQVLSDAFQYYHDPSNWLVIFRFRDDEV